MANRYIGDAVITVSKHGIGSLDAYFKGTVRAGSHSYTTVFRPRSPGEVWRKGPQTYDSAAEALAAFASEPSIGGPSAATASAVRDAVRSARTGHGTFNVRRAPPHRSNPHRALNERRPGEPRATLRYATHGQRAVMNRRAKDNAVARGTWNRAVAESKRYLPAVPRGELDLYARSRKAAQVALATRLMHDPADDRSTTPALRAAYVRAARDGIAPYRAEWPKALRAAVDTTLDELAKDHARIHAGKAARDAVRRLAIEYAAGKGTRSNPAPAGESWVRAQARRRVEQVARRQAFKGSMTPPSRTVPYIRMELDEIANRPATYRNLGVAERDARVKKALEGFVRSGLFVRVDGPAGTSYDLADRRMSGRQRREATRSNPRKKTVRKTTKRKAAKPCDCR